MIRAALSITNTTFTHWRTLKRVKRAACWKRVTRASRIIADTVEQVVIVHHGNRY